MKLHLNVPYKEKDEAKSLGAKWDAHLKKWYIDIAPKHYVNFAKWILKDHDEVIIASEYLYVIEGKQRCWKCHRPTIVIGLGISEFTCIYGDIDQPQYELNDGDELHLAWASQEEDIPPKLLKYLKEHYPVKTNYSKTLDSECFANHCEHCHSLQGNWFLFDEITSPLSSDVEGKALENRISKLKVKCIPIEDDLQLNWDVYFGYNDYAYFEYAKLETVVLSSDLENEWISYEELYEISSFQ